MLEIPTTEVTVWIEKLEDRCKYDAASTCSSNISLQDLIELSSDRKATAGALSLNLLNLTRGPTRGSDSLRTNIAALYPNHTALKENILTTNGGVVGNQVVFQALLSPGDHVICMYPTYEQLYQTPTMIGAEVTLWRLDGANEWSLDLDFLRSSIKTNTKMIILNSPNNPTGAYLSKTMQRSVVEVAKEHDLILFCDEVFRPAFRLDDQNQVPGSFLEFDYENTLVVGSLSKAYSLAGVRVGWIASKSLKLLETCATMRQNSAITVSQLDELVAVEVLNDRCRIPLLERNKRLAQVNLAALQQFVSDNDECTWTMPRSGTTAMLQFCRDGKPVNDKEFCLQLLNKTGALLCPASVCFGINGDFQGYVRIGAAIETHEMENALRAMRDFMKDGFSEVPLASHGIRI